MQATFALGQTVVASIPASAVGALAARTVVGKIVDMDGEMLYLETLADEGWEAVAPEWCKCLEARAECEYEARALGGA